MNKDICPVVSICCVAFNHKLFIKDSIEGFLNQKTSFPIEILIHDDASTDGTAEIIHEYEKKYPDLIFPIYQKENQWSKGINPAKFNRNRARGKYLAYCDGDDYWIDPYKLQKEVDFLEANPDYGLVHTDYSIYYSGKNQFRESYNSYFNEKPFSGEIFEKLLLKNFIGTLTILADKEIMLNAINRIENESGKYKLGDYPIWLEISRDTKVKYLDCVTAVYRVSENTLSFHNDLKKRYDFLQSVFDIQFRFCENYNVGKIYEILLKNYYRFLCNKAFDLKEKKPDPKVIELFVPESIKDKIVKFSFGSQLAGILSRSIFLFAPYIKVLRKVFHL